MHPGVHSILDDMPAMICCFLPDGTIVFANRSYCEYFGKSCKELSGNNFLELIPFSDRQAVMNNISQLTPQSPEMAHEHQVVTPDGSLRWHRWTNRCFFNDQNEITYYQSVGSDISEQKRVKSALDERLKELNCLYGISRLVESVKDLDTILQGIVNLIPDSWQFPKISVARLDVGDRSYRTADHCRQDCHECYQDNLSSSIVLHGQPVGQIRVCYLEKMPEADDGPFLREEAELLNSVAERTGRIIERLRAEQRLQEVQDEMDAIVNASPALIWQKNTDGQYVQVNQKYCETVGISKEDIIGKTDYDLFPADLAEKYVHDDEVTMKQGGSQYGIIENHQKPDGSMGWSRTDKIIWRNRDGHLLGTIGFALDITELKTSERKEQNREAQLRTLIESIPDLVWLKDPEGIYLTCNRKFERFYGALKKDIRGKTDYDFVDKKLADFFRQNDQVAIDAGKPVINEEEVVYADDGHNEILETIKTPIYNSEDKLIGVLGIGRDITDRKHIEETLRSILDHSPIAIWCFDGEKYSYLSKEWYRHTGQDPELALTVDRWTQAVHPDDLEKATQTWMQNWETKTAHINNFRLRGAAGDYKHIQCHAFPIYDSQGTFLYFQGFNIDISDLKTMEENIAKIQKMESIGNLAGGIAHDFNNILFPIIGMSELLLEDLPPGSPERENAEEILSAGKRGRDLVKQILAFSRKSEHKMIPIHIQTILREVIRLSRSTIPSYIEIKQDLKKDCGMIVADPTQIHQIGMNIITNAYHAVEKKGGTISVTLKDRFIDFIESSELDIQSSDYAVLSISDDGHGMSKKIIDKIFEPYFTTKEKGRGTGLGLAVVYGIVKEHKGTIQVRSDVGKGTTFNVYLPLMKKSDRIKSVPEVQELIGGNEHILLVDDERPIINLGKQMLERMGYKVTPRLNSVDALEAFRSKPESYDLVITDMAMPTMTGDQLAGEIRSIRNDIPIIICTGFSERINEEKANALGIDGFLIKPLEKSEMLKMVRNILDRMGQGE